jgi:hypothetical protein
MDDRIEAVAQDADEIIWHTPSSTLPLHPTVEVEPNELYGWRVGETNSTLAPPLPSAARSLARSTIPATKRSSPGIGLRFFWRMVWK